MICDSQKVASKDWVIRDFTKAQHGRLSKVDHEPEINHRKFRCATETIFTKTETNLKKLEIVKTNRKNTIE